MSSRVAGKVILVTGAGSNPGLGRAAAEKFAAEGASVVVTDIDNEAAAACANAIAEAGGKAVSLHHDVTSEADWIAVIDATVAAFGRLDVLVNNAGIAILKRIADLTLEDFTRQQDVNLTSVFLGCKYAVARMREQGQGGSIINISSTAGMIGMARCVAYGASKGGIRALSKSVAIDVAEDNIRCNSVHPGVIWTNMQDQAGKGQRQADSEISRSRVPLGYIGIPDDVAQCLLYLASDEAGYVTGAEFVIDGGMTAG